MSLRTFCTVYSLLTFFTNAVPVDEFRPMLNPHDRRLHTNNYKAIGGGDTGLLVASPSTLTSDEQWIKVQWYNMTYTSHYDWIGLFNATATNDVPFASPPIKYQYICPSFNGCYYPPSDGYLNFRVLNRRTDYKFAYISGSSVYHEIYGISEIVTYTNLYQPMHLHIAHINCEDVQILDNEKTGMKSAIDDEVCMQIMWVQKSINSPKVNYGLTSDNLQYNISASTWISLEADDFCDQEYGMAAGTIGYFDMGYSVTAYLTKLPANTIIFYQVIDNDFGYSSIFNFTSPPVHGNYPANSLQKMIIFGDMGNMAIDFSMHHSWDWNGMGELYSINTSHCIANNYMDGPKETAGSVIHIGDISYAVGYLSEWDDFLHQIEPIASHIPWMTGMGNHEFGYSQEWKPPGSDNADAYGTSDSGGECGVAYNMLFPFANSNGNLSFASKYDPAVVHPWYFYDNGRVRVFILSTEHDFSVSSIQWKWLKNGLENTSRVTFPWIFVAGHRPMYSNDGWSGDLATAVYLRQTLEQLLYDYKIAIGFWGHQHSYGRTCAVFNGTCMGDGRGAVHLIVGMAGYKLTSNLEPPPNTDYIVYQNNSVYGFVHLTIENDTHLVGKFINAGNSQMVEQFSVINPYGYEA